MAGHLLSMQASRHGESRSFGAWRRWRKLAWALLGAALLHAAFFAGLKRTWRAPVLIVHSVASVPAAMWVHDLDAQARDVPPDAQVAQARQAQPRIARGPSEGSRGPGAGKVVPRQASPAASVAPPATPPTVDGAAPVSVPPRADRSAPKVALAENAEPAVQIEPQRSAGVPAPPEPELATAGAHDAVPVYATQIPAPAVLQFRMRRGVVQGNAELTWRVDGGRYEARLEARASGISLLTQVSQGSFDAAGVAPERFTDKRVRRGSVAANFQRELGKVSFSGTVAEVELHAGAQDRLSWMVQLAAIASADPKRLAAQDRIAMHVIGARGDAAVWQFVSSGEGQSEGSPAARRVIKLQRLPQSDYDTQVDVWLDALPPHWPVRAHWRSGPSDPGLELWRIDMAEPR